MRFTFPALATLAMSLPLVSGRVINGLLGRSADLTVDVCAEVIAVLSVDVLGIAIVFGNLDICLCIDAIVDILDVNVVVQAAVALAGEAAVVAELTALINAAPGHETNPCGFQCTDGFTLSPISKPVDCICVPPKIVCNGVCTDAKACPSSVAKRELEVEKRHAVCDRGFTPCGVFEWSGMRASQAWECVDTQSDLESCGGCAVPLMRGTPRGIDCTAIPGVADVSCGAGSCVVHRCLPGYVPSLDRAFCIHKPSLGLEFESEIPAALAYGLELPFVKKAN
ncbi:hypothetical protein EUX98_g3549 [Antrodiella citrinella]|uniref:Protein CPL1-like domain-containing protein n=1 Tax=Antrodiella citrinella TaxID=2447956 RepID=A0A4S4MXB5_9APHY|nr:hypothetical protein EUX98_g3549 [Antrodiella citrinella]